MITLVYSPDEFGWPSTEQFETEQEARDFVKEEIGDPVACDEHGFNPAPLLICGNSHEVKEIEGFRYD